jgi:hypothetical protein
MQIEPHHRQQTLYFDEKRQLIVLGNWSRVHGGYFCPSPRKGKSFSSALIS